MKATSIILYGGKERRFGSRTSKALASVGGRPVIERIMSVLEPISSQIVIVTSPEKMDIPLAGRAAVVIDAYPGKGPLGGIYSGLLRAECHLSIVVACDMPFLNATLLTRMVQMAAGMDVVVPRLAGGMVEPLHAIYDRTCLAKMKDRLEAGHLPITPLFQQLRVRYVERAEYLVIDPRMLSFFNLNSVEDLARANRIAHQLDSGENIRISGVGSARL
jgi:molybdopterin-guanine dinucleotide biosynthesis protein A